MAAKLQFIILIFVYMQYTEALHPILVTKPCTQSPMKNTFSTQLHRPVYCLKLPPIPPFVIEFPPSTSTPEISHNQLTVS